MQEMIPGVVYTIEVPKRRPRRNHKKNHIPFFAAILVIFIVSTMMITTFAQTTVVEDTVIITPAPEFNLPKINTEEVVVTETSEPLPESTVTPEPELEIERDTYALQYWALHDNGKPAGYDTDMGEFRITFYCTCKKCCGKDPSHPAYGITASGKKVTEGTTIAVYRKQISLGTSVYIDGLGIFEAQDTGSAIKENCIDVYVADHDLARQCGVETLKVYTAEE